jgi:hypothetical protein
MRLQAEEARRTSVTEIGLGMQEDDYLHQLNTFHQHQRQAAYYEAATHPHHHLTHHPQHLTNCTTNTNTNTNTNTPNNTTNTTNNTTTNSKSTTNNHLTHQAQQRTTEVVVAASPLHPHFPPHPSHPRHHMEDQDLRSPLVALFPSPPPPTDSRTSSTVTVTDIPMIKYEYELEEASMRHMLAPVGRME